MTEAEWIKRSSPTAMMRYIFVRCSQRKLRLFYSAIARQLEPYLKDERSIQSLKIGEKYADNLVSEDVRIAAFLASRDVVRGVEARLVNTSSERRVEGIAVRLAQVPLLRLISNPSPDQVLDAFGEAFTIIGGATPSGLENCTANLICDIFGNPFRPVTFDPRWRSADAVGLAGAIYEDRAFDRLPLLADALMDAGCDDDQIMSHCRSEGPHVRGCWVLDLVLDKS